MKKVSKIVAFSVLSALAFAACKKTENGPDLTPKEKILTGKIWKLQSLTMPKVETPSVDSSIMQPCADSALIAFDIYKAYQLASASEVPCDSIAVPYDKGNWAFSAGSDSILLKGKRNFVWKIVELSETTLKATFHDSIAPDKNWVKTITFK